MTETPRYTVIQKENKFELRHYSAYIKAEVDVTETTYRKAIFKGFSILAGYIFGNNTTTAKDRHDRSCAVITAPKDRHDEAGHHHR